MKAKVNLRRAMLVALLIGLGTLPVLLIVGLCTPFVMLAFQASLARPHLSEHELEQAVRQLRGQSFTPGLHLDVALPPQFRQMTETGTVDLFRTADGRTIVLFKTAIGYKHNYRGVVYSDAPLTSQEVVSGAGRGQRSSILIDRLQMFIDKRINGRWFEVFNDLG